MKLLQSLNVLVLGLGESGLAMARWCSKHGAQVRVWDSREQPPQREALGDAAQFISSPTIDASSLQDAQLVLRSPGLAPTDPRIAALLDAATKAGIRVANELDLFVAALDDLREIRDYAPKLLAVTGTNGKTTTTALTALLVERAGRTVQAAGNIGPTMLDTLAAAIDDGALPEVWVLELSSFQLHGVDGFEPDAAVVLNVTQDHLDWHGTMEAYVAAKARVYGARGTVVVNRDDPLVAALPAKLLADAPEPKPKSRKRPPPRPVVGFGLQAPTRAGDFGLVVESGMAWLVRATASADGDEVLLQRLMPADALHIRGRHNAANALAALALATAIGCAVAPMLHALRDYRGEPHRVEFIATVGGVDVFDDSKGTNVGATVAALDGLGADKAPSKLVVILGGDGKGQDFAPLTAPLARHARAVATLGRDAAAIEAVLPGDMPARRHDTLDAATRWCFAHALSGDAVLLSPACASLDMFRNYAHRAEVFVAAVREVAAERGEMV
jgi:UDP-N-acetylmuramoylalanine--D-glutamate ligase